MALIPGDPATAILGSFAKPENVEKLNREIGLDKNMRDEYKDSPYWHACAEFCAKYDQNSFDPEYDNMTLEDFEPMVRKVFARPRKSIYKKRDYA